MRGLSQTPAVDPERVKAAADGSVAFAADLYAQLRHDSGNLLVSPYSIGTALAMVAAGARGSTFDEMRRVLHLPAADQVGAAFRGLAATVAAAPGRARSQAEMVVANAIWAQQDRPWKADYLAQLRNDFQADLFGADFRAAAGGVSGRINRWVEEQTRGRIRNLIGPGMLDHNMRVVLTNAIYFKARWASVFRPRDTRPADFILPTGARVKAATMYQQAHFGLMESDFLQVLKLPYDGFTTSMYILLPRMPGDLPDLERRLSAAGIAWWTTIDGTTDVKVWLPKFTFAAPVELGTVLSRMGMAAAFDPAKADFGGMTERPEGLFLSRVTHQAFVAVDEVGTVAAAATGAAGGYGGFRTPPPPPKEFRADRPFLFVIKHEPSGLPLFVGRVLDPTR